MSSDMQAMSRAMRRTTVVMTAIVLALTGLIWSLAVVADRMSRARTSVPAEGDALVLALYLVSGIASVAIVAGAAAYLTATRRRLENQAALQESQQTFRALLDGIPDRAWMKDREGRYVALNRAEEAALGLPVGAVLGKTAFDFRPQDQATAVLAEDQAVMRGGGPLRVERLCDLDPGKVHEIIKVPLRAPDGTVTGLVGVSRDVSDRRAVEQRERARERLFGQLLASTNEGYWLIDNEANTLDLNPAMCRLLGRPREEVIGRSIFDFVDEENAAVFRREIAARASGKTGAYEVTLTRADGSHSTCLNNATALVDDSGAKVASVGLWTDIGDLKAAQQELQAARTEAEAASRVKSQFLANMSHEIRTPMNGVIGMAELLLREPLEDRARNYAGTIHRSARSLLRVLDDILDFSRIEAGMLAIEEVTFSLAHAVGEMESLFREPARTKGVRLGVSLAPGLPAFVRGDPVRLRQVLLNLVANAVKFTARGEIDIAVARAPDGRIRFAVRDSGIGVPAERQAAIFEAFMQVEGGMTRRHGGTGLGLAICRQLVRLMNGEIGLQSQANGGSLFWFELPLRQAESPAPIAAARPARQRFVGRNVLLVEDDPVNREVARGMLEISGIRVVCAGNGAEALSALAAEPFDLVLMDCQMPVMDGFEATRRIRDTEAARGAIRTPIVAVTAHAIAGYRQLCIDAGMDDYLTKPFEMADLEQQLERWISGGEGGVGHLPGKSLQRVNPVLDPAPIEALRTLDAHGDDGLAARVIGVFLETGPQNVRTIRVESAVDRAAAERAAHSLKSSAARLGAQRVSGLAAQLEARLRDDGAQGFEPLLDALDAALEEAMSELQAMPELREVKAARPTS